MSKKLKRLGFTVYHGIVGICFIICMIADHSGEHERLYKVAVVLAVFLYMGRELRRDWRLSGTKN